MTRDQTLVKCECGHIRGDHKSTRPPLGRPVLVGACRVEGCDCRYYVEAAPTTEGMP